ncbi:hypothetical protein CPLU01_03038 [Colletotrichum plurivorum]|uniref:Uncharacterized protein n=1 Tax=Colletotrichum plurivorum TaxID=2175906 RepID=A0A8H6KTI2_9PEZI|nr:hypothetical protein CPLU01_03038 [Colletotrichum plurivorum]
MIGCDDWICQIRGMKAPSSFRFDLKELIDRGEIQPPEGDDKDWMEHAAWVEDLRLLCDPDDEVGQILPSFRFFEIDSEFYSDFSDEEEDPDPSAIRPRSHASEIEVHVGKTKKGPEIYRRPKGPGAKGGLVSMDYIVTSDHRLYACVHAACLEVARKVFATSQIAHIRDMRGLFIALHWREGVAAKCGEPGRTLPRVNYRLGEHQYYAPIIHRELISPPDVDWPGPYKSARSNMFFALGRSPLDVENLTDCLLRNLQPCKSAINLSDEAARLSGSLRRMPPEIIDNIFACMGRDLPRLSSRLLPQRLWKEQLQAGSKGLLPWLWDIDPFLIDAKDAETCPGGSEYEWDWELLIRQLSRGVDYGARPGLPDDVEPDYICTGYSTDLAHVPAGLHNRRRVWQLLEEMFVGDSIPWQKAHIDFWRSGDMKPREKSVRLRWNKSGEMRPLLSGSSVERSMLGKESPQYWQLDAGGPSSGRTEGAEMKPATVEEIYAVLRPLGYPI